MYNLYPEVSILHYRNPQKVWEFKIVLKNKEEAKMLELIMEECTDVYVAFDNCKYLGRG